MRFLRLSILLAAFLAEAATLVGPASAQLTMTGVGGGSAAAASVYQGPGDVVSATPFFWGSCARVFKASLATTSTSLCDLSDPSAPTVVICTLRATSSGFVDLSAYCPGSVTPAAKCNAVGGNICLVAKIYDQVGTNPLNVGAGGGIALPTLLFSALNGLPGITSAVAAGNSLASTSTVTIAQPFSMAAVYSRTGDFTTLGTINSAASNNLVFGGAATASTATLHDPSGAAITSAATDSAFHSLLGVVQTAGNSNRLIVDSNAAATGTAGSGGISTAIRLFRGNFCCNITATTMEAGFWSTAFSGGDETALTSNIHGTNGYNF